MSQLLSEKISTKKSSLNRLANALKACVSEYPNTINNIDKLVKISNERQEYLPFVKLLTNSHCAFGKKLNFDEKFLKSF